MLFRQTRFHDLVFRAAAATGTKERKETRYAWFASELTRPRLSVTLEPLVSLVSLANEFVRMFCFYLHDVHVKICPAVA